MGKKICPDCGEETDFGTSDTVWKILCWKCKEKKDAKLTTFIGGADGGL